MRRSESRISVRILLIPVILVSLFFSFNAAFCADEPPAWLTGVETPESAPTGEVKPPIPASPVPQPVFFSDVPNSHWARSAVYDLVNMGITQGYPDGTFRGENNITRYETALFLSRMAEVVLQKKAGSIKSKQKDFDENYAPRLKAELDGIKKEIEILRAPETPRPEFGYIEGRVRVANLTSVGSKTQTREVAGGPRFDYRLKMKFAGNLNQWLYGDANLDTMDAGWGGGPQRDLSEGLIDVTARAKTPYGLEAFFSAGPGPVVHTEEAGSSFPAENGRVYLRPRNSFGFGVVFPEDKMTASYSALNIAGTNEATISNFRIMVAHDFDEDSTLFGLNEISSAVDYDRVEGSAVDNLTHTTLSISFKPKWGFELLAAGGLSSIHYSSENYYGELALKFKDLLTKGMVMDLSASRNAKDYLNSPAYLAEESALGLDYFDRYRFVQDGGANVGMKITYDASHVTRLKASGVFVLDDSLSYGEDFPGSHSIFEIGLDYVTYTYSTFGFVYKIYNEPGLRDFATSDMMALNAKYEF